MYKLYCRIYQYVLKVANYFLGYRMPEYLKGEGSINKLADLIKAKGINNVLVVTDKGIMKIGLIDKMLESFKEKGINYVLFSNIDPNPTSDNVLEGYKLYQENDCKAFVAFGGGSPMDSAKAIAAKVTRPKKSIRQLQGILKVLKKTPPIFAIPTTSGTGSETTIAALITDSETHHKAAIMDPKLIPDFAILDPELTVGLPPFITATTGMDALCHAIEAYINHTYNTKLEIELSLKASKLIYENIYLAYKDGRDIEARANMQMASFYAGRAFTRGGVGNVHALGHPLGGLYNVPHGLAMAVILPHVLRQYGSKVYKRLAEIANYIGINGNDEKDKALKLISWIEDINEKMGLPKGFDVIEDKDIPQIISWAKKEVNPLYPVPVIFKDEDFKELIDSIRL